MTYGKTAVASIIFFILVYVTTYLSMDYLSSQPSSSCMDCSYAKDVFFFSIVSLFVIPLLVLLRKKVRLGRAVLAGLTLFIFLAIVLFNNLNLFKDRESSWSSYSYEDEVIATIFQSYIHLIIGGVFVLVLSYNYFKQNKSI